MSKMLGELLIQLYESIITYVLGHDNELALIVMGTVILETSLVLSHSILH